MIRIWLKDMRRRKISETVLEKVKIEYNTFSGLTVDAWTSSQKESLHGVDPLPILGDQRPLFYVSGQRL